jgi:D-glycero-D-manno-heptose 1,7-bisphosphate phosphatase
VVIYPGSAEALKRLADAGYTIIMVTNQSGVGRGYFTLEDVERVHRHINEELAKGGAHIEKIYVAPEAPDQPSRGRKPSPQFLFDARDEFGIDLGESFMIGDKALDIETGWNAGVGRSILVRTGYGAKVAGEPGMERAVVVDNLAAAAAWILEQEGRRS